MDLVVLTYEIRQFTAESIKATGIQWSVQIEKHAGELVPGHYRRVLDWAEKNAIYTDGREEFAYGIFEGDSLKADAIVDISYSKSGSKWLKLLDVHLAPSMDLAFNDGKPDLARLGRIFIAAIIGVVGLTRVHKSKVTKLYGRSETLLSFLQGFASLFNGDPNAPNIGVTVEGRWLVFKLK